MQIYTIGHSTRTLDELLALLRAHGVRTLVDIRSIRRSRTNPQFDEAALRRALGRRYAVIDELGGRRGKPKRPPRLANDAWDHASFRNYADHALTAEFRAGLTRLLGLPGPAAILCAEAVWWRCHRRIVADHLLARGVPVAHILSERPATPATLTPFAAVARGRVHYPRGQPGPPSPVEAPNQHAREPRSRSAGRPVTARAGAAGRRGGGSSGPARRRRAGSRGSCRRARRSSSSGPVIGSLRVRPRIVASRRNASIIAAGRASTFFRVPRPSDGARRHRSSAASTAIGYPCRR